MSRMSSMELVRFRGPLPHLATVQPCPALMSYSSSWGGKGCAAARRGFVHDYTKGALNMHPRSRHTYAKQKTLRCTGPGAQAGRRRAARRRVGWKAGLHECNVCMARARRDCPPGLPKVQQHLWGRLGGHRGTHHAVHLFPEPETRFDVGGLQREKWQGGHQTLSYPTMGNDRAPDSPGHPQP
jgi:hypothetical protein